MRWKKGQGGAGIRERWQPLAPTGMKPLRPPRGPSASPSCSHRCQVCPIPPTPCALSALGCWSLWQQITSLPLPSNRHRVTRLYALSFPPWKNCCEKPNSYHFTSRNSLLCYFVRDRGQARGGEEAAGGVRRNHFGWAGFKILAPGFAGRLD